MDQDVVSNERLDPKVIVKIILVVILALISLALIATIARRVIIVECRKKKLNSKNNEYVIAHAGIYLEKLWTFEHKKVEEQIPNEIKRIFLQIKFGNYSAKKEDAQLVLQETMQVKGQVIKQSSIPKKLKFWFVDCL